MKIRKYIDRALDLSMTIILGLMAILVAVNVFSRFVLNSSIYWGDELALVLFVWLTFLGAAVGVREKAHYTFHYFLDRMKGKALKRYMLIGDGLSMIAILILLYYSAYVTLRIEAWIMPAMEISRSLVYGAAPAGCLFMLYYLIERMIMGLRSDPGEGNTNSEKA